MHTALVTGGAAGIGAEICRQLLDAGYEVISLDRTTTDRDFPNLHEMSVDLLDADATRETLEDIVGRFRISHVVHNAGMIRPALLPAVQQDDLHDLAQLHLGAPLLVVQAVLPAMRQAGFGRIVLISSRAALGMEARSAYAASKAGLIGLARTWALELAASGITVNVVAPGPIAGTRLFHDIVPAGGEREAKLAAGVPVRRLGRPADVARAVLFFAAEDNSFITGQTLFVCGGSSLGTVAV